MPFENPRRDFKEKLAKKGPPYRFLSTDLTIHRNAFCSRSNRKSLGKQAQDEQIIVVFCLLIPLVSLLNEPLPVLSKFLHFFLLSYRLYVSSSSWGCFFSSLQAPKIFLPRHHYYPAYRIILVACLAPSALDDSAEAFGMYPDTPWFPF